MSISNTETITIHIRGLVVFGGVGSCSCPITKVGSALAYLRWSPKFGQVVKVGFCS
jgi:hypothetical protein